MTVQSKLVDLINTTDKKKYAYISKKSTNLDAAMLDVASKCDFSVATTLVYLVFPIGIDKLPELDGLFVDQDSTTEEHIRKFVKFNEGATIAWASPETQEIAE